MPWARCAVPTVAGQVLVALLIADVSLAATPCPSMETALLCVDLADTASPAIGDRLEELFSDHGCPVPGDAAASGVLQTSVTEDSLGRILHQLDRQRISYALKPDSRTDTDRKPDLCAYRLVVLSPASEVDSRRPIRAASVTGPSSAKPRKAQTVPFPKLKGGYVSADDNRLLEDFNLLKKSFNGLAVTEKKEALNILLEFYDQWELEEARDFIGRVARGDLRRGVDASVARHAAEILMSIDDG